MNLPNVKFAEKQAGRPITYDEFKNIEKGMKNYLNIFVPTGDNALQQLPKDMKAEITKHLGISFEEMVKQQSKNQKNNTNQK